MRQRLLSVAFLSSLLLACGGDASYTREDLPKLVLQPGEAPEGTRYDGDSSGFQTLEQYAEDNEDKRKRFQDAGFQTAYFAQFLDPAFFETRGQGGGAIAVSFGLLFETEEGAGRGLRALQRSIREEGEDIEDRPAGGLGEEAIGLSGLLDTETPGKPSGFVYAWRSRNAVFGVLAVGPKGTIGEPAVRQLAEIVDARTSPAKG